MCMLPVLGPRYLRERRQMTDQVHRWTSQQLVLEAQTTERLPFLVFEVLERQIYDLLDEAIQQRMQRNLDKETELIFSSGISLCRVRITSVCSLGWFTVDSSNKTRWRVKTCFGKESYCWPMKPWDLPALKLRWAQEKRWSLLPNPSAPISSPFVAHHSTRHAQKKHVIPFVNVLCYWCCNLLLCPLTFLTWCWLWVGTRATRPPGHFVSCTSRTESWGWTAGNTLPGNSWSWSAAGKTTAKIMRGNQLDCISRFKAKHELESNWMWAKAALKGEDTWSNCGSSPLWRDLFSGFSCESERDK